MTQPASGMSMEPPCGHSVSVEAVPRLRHVPGMGLAGGGGGAGVTNHRSRKRTAHQGHSKHWPCSGPEQGQSQAGACGVFLCPEKSHVSGGGGGASPVPASCMSTCAFPGP